MISNELLHTAQDHTYLSLVMAILYSVGQTKTQIGQENISQDSSDIPSVHFTMWGMNILLMATIFVFKNQ